MPSIVCRSRIRAVSDHCSLSLGIRHYLLAGDPSRSVSRPKETRFPDDVDVLLTSSLVITLSGDLDGERISAEELYASELAQNIVDYFQLNAGGLGLNSVSNLELSDNNKDLTVVLTSSRQTPADPEILPVHVLLVAIELCYSWRTPYASQAKLDRNNHPFSERLSLPYKTVLDNVVGRFVTWQLVKRYPLIFGPWCQQLDAESAYFRGVAGSILHILRRSPNKAFRSKCKHFIKLIRVRRKEAQSDATRSLSTYVGSSDAGGDDSLLDIADEDALCYALERVFRDGLPRPQFKGLASMPSADRADDEDLACNHADHPTEAPSSMHCESSLWNEAFMDVLISSSLSNPFANAHGSLGMDSDGENDCPIDIQLDDYHQDILVEEIEDDDDDLPSSDSVVREFDSGGHSFLPGLSFNQHVSASDPFRDMDFTGLTPVLDLDDSDDDTSFNSSQATSHHGNNGFDDLAFGSTFRLINPRGGHIAHVEASEDGNSQDEVSQILGKEGGSQATPTELLISSILPSISGSLSNRVKDSMEQLQTIDYWPQQPTEVTTSREDDADIFAAKDLTRQEAFASDHDLELGFLSDSGCNDSNPMELSFEPNGRFFENSGDSAGVVARHGFLGTAFSHQRTNLNVTWPSQSECEHQLRHSLDAIEDSDEEFWNAEIGGDLGVGEDDMFAVVEFDHDSAP